MNDLISRKVAIDDIETVNPSMPLSVNWVKNWVKTLPPAQSDITEDDVKEFCKKRCWIVVTSDLYDEMIQRWSSAQPGQDEWCTDCKEYDSEKHCCPRFNRVIRNALKDAQPEKKGKWIVHPEVKNVYGGTYIECSQCGEKYVVQYMEDEKYCRNCGAKMEREQKHLGNKSDLVILDEVKYE